MVMAEVGLEQYYAKMPKEKIQEISGRAKEISTSLNQKKIRVGEIKSQLRQTKNISDRKNLMNELSSTMKEIEDLTLQQKICINEACKNNLKELSGKGNGEVEKRAEI